MTRARGRALALVGFVMAVTAVWGGGCLMDQIPLNDWRQFPTFATLCCFAVCGVAMIFQGLDP